MKAVIQRVSRASVSCGEEKASIGRGYLVQGGQRGHLRLGRHQDRRAADL